MSQQSGLHGSGTLAREAYKTALKTAAGLRGFGVALVFCLVGFVAYSAAVDSAIKIVACSAVVAVAAVLFFGAVQKALENARELYDHERHDLQVDHAKRRWCINTLFKNQ